MSKSSLRVVYAPEAERDLIDRADYLAEEAGQRIADRFVEAVAHTLGLLAQMPNMGKAFRSRRSRPNQLRTIPASGAFGHSLIFYTCSESELRVERILHSAQDLRRFFP